MRNFGLRTLYLLTGMWWKFKTIDAVSPIKTHVVNFSYSIMKGSHLELIDKMSGYVVSDDYEHCRTIHADSDEKARAIAKFLKKTLIGCEVDIIELDEPLLAVPSSWGVDFTYVSHSHICKECGAVNKRCYPDEEGEHRCSKCDSLVTRLRDLSLKEVKTHVTKYSKAA